MSLAVVFALIGLGSHPNAQLVCSSDEAKAEVAKIADRVIAKPTLTAVTNSAALLRQRTSELEAEIAAARAHSLPGYAGMPDCAEPHGMTCFDYTRRIAGDI